jgi:hypothetical protein
MLIDWKSNHFEKALKIRCDDYRDRCQMLKKTLSVIILFTLCFAIIAQVSAQTPQVNIGVKEGDTFKYQATYFWNSTNPNDTVPIGFVEQNTTEWLQATIKTVTGSTVTITEVQHFQNGTEVPREEITYVGTVNQLSVLLYAANLNAGDYVLPMADLPYYTVNATVSRNYTGGPRETNYLLNSITDVDVNGDNITDYAYMYTSRFFDRQTGILVQGHFEYGSATNPGQAYAYEYKLTESNVWTVSAPSSDGNGDGTPTSWFTSEVLYVIIIVVVLVAVIASVLLIRKRKSKPKRQ